MQIRIIGLNTRFFSKDCEVTVQLIETLNSIKRVADTLTFTIPKPYSSIDAAVEYECAVYLSKNGYAVSVPDVVPEGILPEQDITSIFPEPAVRTTQA